MSVKASVSISAQQQAFARDLVRQGRYTSVSAVVQRGLDLLRQEDEVRDADLSDLRAVLADRATGPFMTVAEGRAETAAMLAARRLALGL